MNIQGHELVLPETILQFEAGVSDQGTLDVWYTTPDGEANLSWNDGWSSGWTGLFETTSGVMEEAQLDGSFSMTDAYYLDAIEYDIMPEQFLPYLMTLGALDHLVMA